MSKKEPFSQFAGFLEAIVSAYLSLEGTYFLKWELTWADD